MRVSCAPSVLCNGLRYGPDHVIAKSPGKPWKMASLEIYGKRNLFVKIFSLGPAPRQELEVRHGRMKLTHGIDLDSLYRHGLMVETWTLGIDIHSWYKHGLMVLTKPMVSTQTHGIVSVLLNHTHTRGPGVACMQKFLLNCLCLIWTFSPLFPGPAELSAPQMAHSASLSSCLQSWQPAELGAGRHS